MYSIKANGTVIYAPNVTNQGYNVTRPRLTTEINKAGSLEFTIPPTNPAYNAYSKLKTIITVEEDGKEIWRGRVLDDTKDMYNNKQLTCEGELAFLNDVLIRPSEYNGVTGLHNIFRMLVNKYSSVASPYRDIRPGNITVPDTSLQVSIDNPSNVMTELGDQLVSSVGGYLVLRRTNGVSYLDYIDDFDDVSNQTIRFGENLLDIEEFIDASEVYTVMIPYGKKDDNGVRVDITSVNGGNDWIQSDQGIELFGKIEQSVAWDDITDPLQLLTAAQALMNEAIEMATTITIKAVDLHFLNVNTDSIKIGQFIPVVSVPHGIDAQFLCSKITIDMVEPGNTEYALGLVFNALTDQQVSANKQSANAYESAKTTEDNFNSLRNETYENYVSKAEFNSTIGEIQDQLDNINIPDLSEYAKKEDLENYVLKTEYDALEQRVEALEQAQGGN